MHSDPSAENTLQQVNTSYMLLDNLFHKLDSTNPDNDQLSYVSKNLDAVIKHLNNINTYLHL